MSGFTTTFKFSQPTRVCIRLCKHTHGIVVLIVVGEGWEEGQVARHTGVEGSGKSTEDGKREGEKIALGFPSRCEPG